MYWPSGDQPGSISLESPDVNRCGSPPSASTTKMSAWPNFRESKAMRFPSGDQRGDPVTGPLKNVRRRLCLDPLSKIQISLRPERLLRNAILFPSGEKRGLEFNPLEEIHGSLGASPPGR